MDCFLLQSSEKKLSNVHEQNVIQAKKADNCKGRPVQTNAEIFVNEQQQQKLAAVVHLF